MTATAPHTWARRIGLALGLLLAVAAILVWRVPAEGRELGAELRMTAMPPGELIAEPSGPFVVARRLRPDGHAAGGSVTIRNIAPRPVEVRARAIPSSRDLDGLLRVELTIGGRPVAEGTLRELRGWSEAVRIENGARRTLEASVGLSADARREHDGVILDVGLELDAEVVR